MRKEVDIFMCCTPYSFIIAYNLAIESKGKKILVIYDDFNYKWIIDTFREINDKIFIDIFILEKSEFNIKSIFKSLKNILANRLIINKILKKYLLKDSFIPNPYIPEFTILGNNSRKKILFEEGIGLLKDSENDKKINLLKQLIKKILYGNYTEINKSVNFLEYFDDYFLSNTQFSKNIKLSINKKIIAKLDIKKIFTNFSNTSFFKCLENRYLDKDFIDTKILVLLGRSTFKEEMPENISAYYNFLGSLKKNNNSVMFKYHPREINFYFGQKSKISDLPAELILMFYKNINFILGLSSSFLYNSKKFDNNIKVISLLNLFGFKKENINSIFLKEGILMPDTIKDLKIILEKNGKI